MTTVIRTQGLTKRFGDFTAVDNVTFSIEAGEVVGYLGPNGSGKTTTIRMLLGLLSPSEGSADVLGYDIVHQSEDVRANVGYMSQKFSLYNDLTVFENLSFYGGIYGVTENARLEDALHLVGLNGFEKELVNNLSTGWRQRLALATAIVHQPPLLFLDEPTSGVDPSARRAFWDLIYTLADQNITVLVTTHYMDEAEYCTLVGIMREGRLLAMNKPQILKETCLHGLVWDIHAEPLLNVLAGLEQDEHVIRARLAGDHLSAITDSETDEAALTKIIRHTGGTQISIERIEATLEDVFLALARETIEPFHSDHS